MLRVVVVFLIINIGYFLCHVESDPRRSKLEIAKCCAENEAIFVDVNDTWSCQSFDIGVPSYANVTVYDKNFHDKPSRKSFLDIFRVAPDKTPIKEVFEQEYFDVDSFSKPYLSEDGLLYSEYPNSYVRWVPANNSVFCIDFHLVQKDNSTELELADDVSFYCAYFGETPPSTNSFFPIALLVSVVFLTLVLVVYMLLPGLRNLGGKVLMAYVFSLLMAFVFLAVVQLFRHDAEVCIGLTTTVYFFFLASFCWMTVMSYDIWWTFRGYAKARPIHRRGENFKFCMYCIYGWGVPLAMSIAFVVINRSDLSHMPWFVKPQIPDMGCFLEGGQKLVYLYAPMLILIICNWMFFLMTAFNIWRLHRGTAVLDSPAAGTAQAHRKQRNRFFIYLKLSVIMGINWLLEVISSLAPQYNFWYISDTYNLLIGLAIFLIFVCKKKIYRSLRARFTEKRVPQPSLTKSQTSSTTLSAVSQDTPMQVLHHPNGINTKR